MAAIEKHHEDIGLYLGEEGEEAHFKMQYVRPKKLLIWVGIFCFK